MLEAIRRSIARAAIPLCLSLTAAFALSTSGCSAFITGVHDTTLTFPLEQKVNGTFWAWNEITIDQDLSSVEKGTLVSVTLKVITPPGQTFAFLSSLKGEVVSDSGRTLAATLDRVPPDEAIVMDIQYHDDLRPLFRDDNTIRIEWSGVTNPGFTGWPAGGYTIEAHVQIEIE